ncbi:RNA-directed DNA polymerase from mobile element jockey [Trichonephila clavipes]|nr:RNA-directed DNA polymerase from mobile element jockey [Trichonephila clavipes]
MQRLNQHCAAVNFIIPQQCGFRPKCSTVHQLLRVTELIHSGFAKHEATGILFLDIAKAFDKIWHDGLLIKLIRLDFPAPLIKSIHSFLSHRSGEHILFNRAPARGVVLFLCVSRRKEQETTRHRTLSVGWG